MTLPCGCGSTICEKHKSLVEALQVDLHDPDTAAKLGRICSGLTQLYEHREKMRILKFTLDITDSQVLIFNRGAELLSVGNQNGKLCLWVKCDAANETVRRTIQVCGTGNRLPADLGRFIGTAIFPGMVWHVFDGGEA